MAPDGQRPSTRAGRRQRHRLIVTVADTRGRELRMAGLSSWLARVAPARARGSVSIGLLSDRRIRDLNSRYRRVDRVTDVLSFPSGSALRQEPGPPCPEAEALPAPGVEGSLEPFLGDIVIARGVARRQARDARHAEMTELRLLALHGLLHLLGYDHERDGGQMGRLERRLRRKGGLPEGLIERATRR